METNPFFVGVKASVNVIERLYKGKIIQHKVKSKSIDSTGEMLSSLNFLAGMRNGSIPIPERFSRYPHFALPSRFRPLLSASDARFLLLH